MRAAERRRRPRCDLRWLTLIAGLISVVPGHADVELEGAIGVGVAHTDNLTLSSANPERETVYQLFPSFNLRQESARMTTDMSYRVEAYRYDNRSDSNSYQNLNANSQVALDPDNFFLELGASRDQTIRNPEAAIARSNLAITTNRVDRDNYYVSPGFQYPLSSNGTVRGSYRRTRTRYDEAESAAFLAADFDTDAFGLAVDNYRKERGFTWAVRYSADKTDYGVFLPWEYRQAAAEVGAWVAQGWRLFATGGRESSWATPLDPSLADTFWEVGFARQGGESLQLEFAAGERTFGSSRRASLDYSFGRGRMQLSYAEQPTTERRSGGDGLTISDLLAGALDDLLARPGDTQRFLSNRFDWSIGFDLRRTQVSLAIFDESRTERARIDGTPLEDEGQSGGAFAVSWRLGAKTGLQVRADRSRREFGVDREQNLRYLSVGADYRLGGRTSLALYLTRAEEDSLGSGSSEDYEADLISLLLTRTF
jgi:uncharacterized protein (PEP-CTERM system associated)